VSTMDLIASSAISWPLRTMERNWSWSSCWVVVLALAIVFASLLASAANFTKQRLACQAEMLDLFCSGRLGRGGLGGRGLRRLALARGGLGGRGGLRRSGLRVCRLGCPGLRRGLGHGLLGCLGGLGHRGLRGR